MDNVSKDGGFTPYIEGFALKKMALENTSSPTKSYNALFTFNNLDIAIIQGGILGAYDLFPIS
jgi:hypothetical protein